MRTTDPDTVMRKCANYNKIHQALEEARRDMHPILKEFIGKKVVNDDGTVLHTLRKRLEAVGFTSMSHWRKCEKNISEDFRIYIDTSFAYTLYLKATMRESSGDHFQYTDDMLPVGNMDSGNCVLTGVYDPVMSPPLDAQQQIEAILEWERLDVAASEARDKIHYIFRR